MSDDPKNPMVEQMRDVMSRARDRREWRDRVDYEATQKRELEDYKLAKARETAAASIVKTPWLASERDFGDWVLRAYRNGAIPATGELDALEKMCRYFADKNGLDMVPGNIVKSLRKRKQDEHKEADGRF